MILVVVIVFPHWRFFTFPGYFSMPPAFHPSISGPWRSQLALTSTLATFGCFTYPRLFHNSFIPSATVLSGHYLTTGVVYLLFHHPHFWHVLWLRCRQEHPGSFSVPSLTELSLPGNAWIPTSHIVVTRPLIYQLRQWGTKYRVKIELLNMFHLFKVIRKDYKNTLNKTWCAA